MPKKVVRLFPTLDVVAAACAAYRINGAYIKVPYQLGDENKRKTNRELVYSFLEDQSSIIDDDRSMAEDIKQFFKGYTFKLLSGAYLSEFDRNVMKMLEEEFTPEGYNVATLTSIPGVYLKAKQRQAADSRVRQSQGGYVGTIGERLNLQVEVLKCVFSQKWGIFYVTAITSSDQAVFFGYKQEVTAGTVLNIKGTVKRHNEDTTQLNRVSLVD